MKATPADSKAQKWLKRWTGKKDRQKALKAVEDDVGRRFGAGTLQRMDGKQLVAVEVISTGSPAIDRALGVLGYPRGRIVEVYGEESSGKTTLALHAIAQCQADGGQCVFVDAEHALDPTYAKALGVSVESLLVSQPDCGEQALDVVELVARSGAVDLIVVDSVAALVPRAEIDGQMGDAHVGLQARLMSQAMRKLASVAYQTGTTIFFINQTRTKIGVTFGSPHTTTGGKALRFYASVRMEIRRIGAIKRGEEIVGNRTRVKVVKNKMAPPFRQAEVEVRYGIGIDNAAEWLDQALDVGAVQRAGAWFSMGETRLGQGREAVLQRLREDPALLSTLKARLADASGGNESSDIATEVATA